ALRASATYPSTPIGEHEVEQLLEPPTLAPDSPPQNFHRVDGLIRQYERDIIMRCLTATGGNQRRAARQLRMPKSTLHDRVHLYQIDVKALKRAAKENAKKPTLKDKT